VSAQHQKTHFDLPFVFCCFLASTLIDLFPSPLQLAEVMSLLSKMKAIWMQLELQNLLLL
jgi:hypothetical protein